MFLDRLKKIKPTYQTLNCLEIKTQALQQNYQWFQTSHPGISLAPVLKSNAYGHGLELVGKWLDQKIHPPFIVVDSLYEAYKLDKTGIHTPLLIIGYTNPENFKIHRRLPFIFPLYDLETAQILNKYQPGARVHLKIDTGMNRLGICPEEAFDFARKLKQFPHLKIEGIYSHLSQADNPRKKDFTLSQIKKMKETIHIFENEGFHFDWKHISATNGSLLKDDPEFNLIRLGIGFYGLIDLPENHPARENMEKNLQPALELKTHLVHLKKIPAGSEIGYGGTFVAPREMKIGILPLGYYDGLDRRLSNRGVVEIRGKFCPIVGRVCMNLTIIDLTTVDDAQRGDEVVVFSSSRNKPNSFPNSAKLAGTIAYVLLVQLSETTRRKKIEEEIS